MTSERSVILNIAVSLDGYIAGPNDNLSFLSAFQKPGEDYGYNHLIKTIDTVILGRRTYDWVMKQVPVFPHEDKTTFVITHTEKPGVGKTVFYSGSLKELVTELKRGKGKNILCDGGSEIVNELLKDRLIDELVISIIPVMVGSGIKLFKDGRPGQSLKLFSLKKFHSGLVQLHYLFVELNTNVI